MAIRLVHPENKPIIGSQVRIELDDRTITRQVSTSTGQGNQNQMTMHFGLGKYEKETIEVQVKWIGGSETKRSVAVNELNILRKRKD